MINRYRILDKQVVDDQSAGPCLNSRGRRACHDIALEYQTCSTRLDIDIMVELSGGLVEVFRAAPAIVINQAVFNEDSVHAINKKPLGVPIRVEIIRDDGAAQGNSAYGASAFSLYAIALVSLDEAVIDYQIVERPENKDAFAGSLHIGMLIRDRVDAFNGQMPNRVHRPSTFDF